MTLRKDFPREYKSWKCMRDRCERSSNDRFRYYGGRGIKVCDRWNNFENFLSDLGPRPIGTSLDRIDNDGNYEPDNCRWATQSQQRLNSSTGRILSFNGKSQNLHFWLVDLNISRSVFYARTRRGWPVEKSLFTPVQRKSS